MKERPILFSAPMVRALLAGTKTQTRRICKLPHQNPLGKWEPTTFGGPNGGRTSKGETVPEHTAIWHTRTGDSIAAPYIVGEMLWVREAWGYFDPDGTGEDYDRDHNEEGRAGPCSAYHADMLQEGNSLRDYWRRRIAYKASFAEQKYGMGPVGPSRWRPSIHMPRWASRITLEIVSVRVERLQDISEADAIAEGTERLPHAGWKDYGDSTDWCTDPISSYRTLWESINGFQSSKDNPWVCVVEFKRITP